MSSNGERAIGREHLPIPYPTWVGVTTGDAKDPATQVASHWGGTRNGTIVRWPEGI